MSTKGLDIEQVNFARQIKQYSIDLQQIMSQLVALIRSCRSLDHNQYSLGAIRVMLQKIQMEIDKYRQAIAKIQNKIMTKGGMQSLKNYFNNNYNKLVKESYQLMSVCQNKAKLPTENDFKKVRQLQEQLDHEWGNIAEERINVSASTGTNYNYNSNQSGLTKQQNLTKMAASQIQQQFLAIRMVAYKMYERHNAHTHSKLYEQLQMLRQEQGKLAKQITDMQQVRMDLIAEQRKLFKQLAQVKKINQLVGRRYFIEDSRIQTNFTTN